MNPISEQDGTFVLHNKRLMRFGRILTLLVALVSVYGFVIAIHHGNTTETINEKFIRSAIIGFFVVLFIIFLCLLIGGRYTTISEKGIDTYRDMYFFKFRKRHLDPGEYSLRSVYIGRAFTTDIYIVIGRKKLAIYSYMYLGCSYDDFVKQIDEALSHYASFSKADK